VSELNSHNNLLNTPIYGNYLKKSFLPYRIPYIRAFFYVSIPLPAYPGPLFRVFLQANIGLHKW
jgi:hypothetical protein